MPASPDGGVFVAAGNWISGGGESFYTDINGLIVGQEYTVRFFQANAGIDGITPLNEMTGWRVVFGSEEQFTEKMPYLGEGNQVWQEADLTFTATAATQRLEFFADDDGDPNNSPDSTEYMAIDGIQVLTVDPLTTDTDGDGISDHLDLDSDNDGIRDVEESGFANPEYDTNNDGTISIAEAEAVLGVGNADADGDGLMDIFDADTGDLSTTASVGTLPVDSDSDGVDDYLDLDSDGDGIADTVEARPTAGYVANDGDVTDNDADGDGVIDIFDANDGTTGDFGGTFAAVEDTDGDGTADYLDTDSDNDMFSDTAESGLTLSGTDANGDGIDDDASIGVSYSDPDGTVNNPQVALSNEFGDTSEVGYRELPDTDGDGISDRDDIDDDNDGILNVNETNDQLEYATFTDTSSGTLGDAGFTIATGAEVDGGMLNNLSIRTVADIGQDHFQNPVAGRGGSGSADILFIKYDAVNSTTRYTDLLFTFDAPVSNLTLHIHNNDWGMFELIGASGQLFYNGSEYTQSGLAFFDSDGGTHSDPARDGYGAILLDGGAPVTSFTLRLKDNPTTSNIGSGDLTAVHLSTYVSDRDTDGDGISDHVDLDSDNDGIRDVEESGFANPEYDTNNDGTISIAEAEAVLGAGNADADGDGLMDIFDADITDMSDAASIGTVTVDSDSDGVDDVLDLDSDSDGIADTVEARPTAVYNANDGDVTDNDADGDGVIDLFDGNDGTSGDLGGTFAAVEDTDGDGTADYLDADSDNDGMLDSAESGLTLSGTDANGDGIDDDASISASYADPDGTVDNPQTALANEFGDTSEVAYREALDTDGDGIIDVDDIDDDNDGILDLNERIEVPASLTFQRNNGTYSWNTSLPGVQYDMVVSGSAPAGPVSILDSSRTGHIGENQTRQHSFFEAGSTTELVGLNGFVLNVSDFEASQSIAEVTITLLNGSVVRYGGGHGWAGWVDVDGKAWGDPASKLNSNANGDLTSDYIWEWGRQSGKIARLDLSDLYIHSISFKGGAISDQMVGWVNTSHNASLTIDTDGDGVSDHLDLDSDNDGIRDLEESGFANPEYDTNNDGTVSIAEAEAVLGAGNADADGDGLMDVFDVDIADGSSAASIGTVPVDSDSDGVDDVLDLDSDGDGIADTVEARPTAAYTANDGDVTDNDADGDGVIDLFDGNDGTSGDFGGTFAAVEDTDGDGTADYLDADSDNDGMLDSAESGLTLSGTDANGDGIDDDASISASYADPDGTVDNPQTALANEFGDTSEVAYREVITPPVLDLDASDSTANPGTFSTTVELSDDGTTSTGTIGDGVSVSADYTLTFNSQSGYTETRGVALAGSNQIRAGLVGDSANSPDAYDVTIAVTPHANVIVNTLTVTQGETDLSAGTITLTWTGGGEASIVDPDNQIANYNDGDVIATGAVLQFTPDIVGGTWGVVVDSDNVTVAYAADGESFGEQLHFSADMSPAGYTTTFTENGPAVAIADTDTLIVDDDDSDMESAVVTLTNPQADDRLRVDGTPLASGDSGVTASGLNYAVTTGGGGEIVITLTGTASKAVYADTIEAITFENTSEAPDTGDRLVDVVVNDGDFDSNVATALIQVVEVNDAPSAADDTITTPEDTPVTFDPLANDSDVDGTLDPTSVVFVNAPAGSTLSPDDKTLTVPGEGVWTVDPVSGEVTFTPETDYNGTATPVEYQVADDDGATVTAMITVTVIPVDDTGTITGTTDNNGNVGGTDAQVLESDLGTGTNPLGTGESVSGSFTIADDDGIASLAIDGTVVTLAALNAATPGAPIDITSPAHGTLSITGFNAATGEVSYSYTLDTADTHTGGVPTIESIGLILTDSTGTGTVGTLGIAIIDDTPVANGDNDRAINQLGQPTSIATGNVITGTDVSVGPDGDGADGTADEPGADGLAATPVTGVVAGAGTPLAGNVGIPVVGSFGTITLNGDGTYIYTPDLSNPAVSGLGVNDQVTEVFTYEVTDADGSTDTATLTITITGTPAIVSASTGTAGATDGSVLESDLATGTNAVGTGETLTGTFSAVAPDGLISISVNGTSYTEAALLAATSGAPITVTTSIGTLRITNYDAATGAIDYSYTLDRAQDHSGGAVTDTLTLSVTDIDGDTGNGTLRFEVVDDQPLAANDLDTVTEDATGVDAVATGNVVTAIDNAGGDSNASDGVTDVIGADAASNPVTAVGAGAGAPTGGVGSAIAGSYGTLTLNADGSYSYAVDNSNAAVDALNVGDSLNDVFTYEITDVDGTTQTATLTITIAGANDVPVATDDTITTPEDTPVTFDPLANDSDVDGTLDPTSVVFVNAPTGSTLSPDGKTLTVPGEGVWTVDPVSGEVTFSPEADYNGSVTPVEYQVSDDSGVTATATIVATITDVNDPPIAVDDTVSTPEGTPVIIDLVANDSDVDSTVLTVTEVNGTPVGSPIATTHGSVTMNPDGTYTYTPDSGYIGNDTFTYEVCDENGLCDVATVYITVVDGPPVAVDDLVETSGGTPVSGNVLSNDFDSNPSDTLTVNTTPVTAPANGTLVLNADGTFTYTPNEGFAGIDTFEYEVCDESGKCDTATVQLTVLNQPPEANDDFARTPIGEPVTIPVLENDVDPNGDPLSVVVLSVDQGGSVTVNPDGTVTFTPDNSFTGTATINYLIEDPSGATSTATIQVEVFLPYTWDSNHEFSKDFEMSGRESSPNQQPMLTRQIYTLAPEPILSGYARPGTQVVGRIYDGAGRLIGEGFANTDPGGNWMMQMHGVAKFEHYRIEIDYVQATGDIYGYLGLNPSDSTYQTMQSLTGGGQPLSVEGAIGNAPAQTLADLHKVHNRPLGMGLH